MSPSRLRLLTWSGCPSHDDAVALLRATLARIGLPDQPFDVEWVENETDAEHLGFVGSPSFRVDDEDVIPLGGESAFGLTCRVYRTSGGKFSPLPDREQFAARLTALLKGEAA